MLDQENTQKLAPFKGALHGQDPIRAHFRPRFLPGVRLSVELAHCRHRVRVEAHASGFPPRRARCPRRRRWRMTIPATARTPSPNNVTRAVVAERIEERDGRLFTVTALKTPRRARFADNKPAEPGAAPSGFRPALDVVFEANTPLVAEAPISEVLREINDHIVSRVLPPLVGFQK
jgi:hypothetical protein